VWVGSVIRASSWSAAADHGQQHLNTEAVPAIWLKDLQAGFVIEFLTGPRRR
jgi:hypothetical protein